MRGIRLAALIICCALPVAITACSTTQAVRPAAASFANHASHTDRLWINQAHQANLAELQVGDLAASGKGTKAVEPAGAMLVHDHQVLDRDLVRVAKELKLVLPTSPSVTQTEIGDLLSSKDGQQFDQYFAATMVTAHESIIAATRHEIAAGSDPAVIRLARQALPVLMKHLRMMRALVAKVG